MPKYNYEYGTTPGKIEPNYRRTKKKKKKNNLKKAQPVKSDKINTAMKLEKRKHYQNVALIVAIFLLLLAVSYRNSLINEQFSKLQKQKNELAATQKTNEQLEVSIEESINLSTIEAEAKEQLGMQKLDNSQKVYVTLDKKDFVEPSSKALDINESTYNKWYEKIINKIFGK